VNYVRSHDDIGWTFSDEDALQFAINGYLHREFLNNFYLGKFAGSFAQGVPFQENLKNGDCRISGTTASLAGLGRQDKYAVARILAIYNIMMTTGGIPLIYLGDEVGVLNDLSYLKDKNKSSDSRWVHRVKRNQVHYDDAINAKNKSATAIFTGLKRLIATRKKTPALAGGSLTTLETKNPHVLAFARTHAGENVYVIANFSETTQPIQVLDTPLTDLQWLDLLSNKTISIQQDFVLAPYEFMWLK
jgi:amylosucrase